MARYRNPDGTIYDDRYAGPGALQRPTGAPESIVQPLTTQTARQEREQAPAPPVSFEAPGSVKISGSITAPQAGPQMVNGSYRSSQRVSRYSAPEAAPFRPSGDTLDYQDRLRDMELDKPGPFQSRYEPAIQSILDNILNRKPFDVSKDANYQMLYNQARESYMNAGNKAMRDAMGAMQAQTGGYGSTAAQIAGSQAYDSYLQGMNDNNAQLMQLAYGMYQDEMADRYNQLQATTGLDNTDYGRYRDTVGDYYRDLDYLANRYDTGYGRDYGQYVDDRNYAYQTAMDKMAQENWEEQMDYKAAADALAQSNWQAEFDYQKEKDALARLAAASRGSGGSGGSGRSSKADTGLADTATEYPTIREIMLASRDMSIDDDTFFDLVKGAKEFYKSAEYAAQNGKSTVDSVLKNIDQYVKDRSKRRSKARDTSKDVETAYNRLRGER